MEMSIRPVDEPRRLPVVEPVSGFMIALLVLELVLRGVTTTEVASV